MKKTTKRKLNGILIFDKPKGFSSSYFVKKLKWLFSAQKTGHSGALDPIATGMLPICFGEATKFSRFLLEADKTYRVIAKLGERTTTSDSEGEIIQTRKISVSQNDILCAIAHFSGEIQQIPSMYSALKFQGKPLYEYVRKGIFVPRESRTIHVFKNELIQFDENSIELEIHCSKGTYIRTIIDDLGEFLGCGAHVTELRRLNIAQFSQENMINLNELEKCMGNFEALDRFLLPLDSQISHLPKINLSQIDSQFLLKGRKIQINFAKEHEIIRIYNEENNEFLGVGLIDLNGFLQPKRLISE